MILVQYRQVKIGTTGCIQNLLDTDAVVDSAERLKDEETGILNEVVQTGYQKEIID